MQVKDLKGALKTVTFSGVFDAASTQEDIYNAVRETRVLPAFDGYKCTLVSHGNIGTGKSHTIVSFAAVSLDFSSL